MGRCYRIFAEGTNADRYHDSVVAVGSRLAAAANRHTITTRLMSEVIRVVVLVRQTLYIVVVRNSCSAFIILSY